MVRHALKILQHFLSVLCTFKLRHVAKEMDEPFNDWHSQEGHTNFQISAESSFKDL